MDGLGVMIDGLHVIIDGLGVIKDGLGVIMNVLGVIIDGLGVIIDGLGAIMEGLGVIIDGLGVMMDGLGALKHLTASQGVLHSMKLTAAALRDLARQKLGRKPEYLPVVGAPGEWAALATADAKAGYLRITPDDWPNRMTAGMLLSLALYRPGLQADQVAAPILFVVAATDSICPPADVEAAAARAGDKATVLRLETGHFEIYVDDWFEQGCAAQTAFLTEHLTP